MHTELKLDLNEDDFVDIMEPWKARAEAARRKWPRLDELISEPEDYFHQGKVSGRDVPRLWQSYKADRLHCPPLRVIMAHCLRDVLRESLQF